MLCTTCGEDREIDDFLLGCKECYKCVYKRKMATIKEPATKKKPRVCKICGTVVRPPKTAFCCDECAHIGWEKQRKEYWVRKVLVTGGKFNPWPRYNG